MEPLLNSSLPQITMRISIWCLRVQWLGTDKISKHFISKSYINVT
jgi:hypothetical protein